MSGHEIQELESYVHWKWSHHLSYSKYEQVYWGRSEEYNTHKYKHESRKNEKFKKLYKHNL